MKKIISLVCLLYCVPIFAQSTTADKAQVLNVMEKYVQTIACQLEKIKSENIVNMTTSLDFTDVYYVLWWGDIGCAAGASTMTANITAVEKNKWMKFDYNVSVYPVLEDEVYYKLNPRFIENLQRISENKMEIISSEIDPSTFNHPGRKYRYIFQRSERGAKWVLKNKIFISNTIR